METKPWKIELPSRNIEIELTTVQSNYHVELNPSDVGNQDRYIVQEVIKVMPRASFTVGSQLLLGGTCCAVLDSVARISLTKLQTSLLLLCLGDSPLKCLKDNSGDNDYRASLEPFMV